MQIIRVPNYDFRRLSTGQLLAERATAASTTLELEAVTGFVVDQFAVLGYDSDRENRELTQVTAISSPNLSVGAISYEHQPEFLVYPCPYDQIELYKKRSGGSMQLLERKDLDVDGVYTVFVDTTAEKADTYEYKYRNSVSQALSTASASGIEYYRTKEPYVTPEEVIEFMNHPSGIDASDPNLIMLCDAYSDLLDHTVGRYQNERLWYHYEKVVVPMHRVKSNNKIRLQGVNDRPVVEVISAHVVDPKTGQQEEIDKPYEVGSSAVIYLPGLDDLSNFDETDRIHMLIKVGFFESNNVPQDIRMMLCNAIAMYIRNQDMIRRYVHQSGQLVSGERSQKAFVRSVTVAKYTKMYFESAAEVTGERVNAKALEAVGVAFEASQLYNCKDVLRPYKQTFSMSFI